MTPRRRRTQPPDPSVELATLPLVETAPPLTGIEERYDEELEDILEEVGTSARIKVWQTVDGKTSYAGEISGADFSLETLLDTFGGGDKTLAIYQGKTKRTTLKVSLDPTVPVKNPRTPKTDVVAAPSSVNSELTGMMTAMAASTLQSAGAMNQIMTGVIGAMGSLMAAARPTKDPTELALEMVKVLRAGESSRETSPSDFLSAFKQGMEIGEKVGGSGPDDDGVMLAVHKGLDTLGTIVAGIVENNKNKQPPPVMIAAPAPTAVVTPSGTAPVPPRESTDFPGQPFGPGDTITTISEPSTQEGATVGAIRPWVAAARPFIGHLLTASKFMPPDAAAATIAKNLDDDQFFDLIEDISDQDGGGFGVRLATYFPQVKTVEAEWIGQVVQVLLTEYVEPDDGTPDGTFPTRTPDNSPEGGKAS